MNRRLSVLAYLLLLAASLGLYGRTIAFPFLRYDDTLLIVDNQAFLQDLRNIPRAFLQDVWSVPGHRSSGSYYRPLYTLSFMFDAQLGGTDPAFYHFTSVLLHGLAACLVFTLLRRLGASLFSGLAVALFFALHPVFVSVVAWVPGRNDSLLAVFVVCAMLFLERFAGSGKSSALILHFGFLTASFFTKEAALVFPLLGCVYVATVGRERLLKAHKQMLLAGWILLSALWAAVRFLAVSPGELGPGLLANLADNWILLVHYLGKAVIPVQLALVPTLEDTSPVPGIAVLLGIGTLAILRRFVPVGQALFGMTWFFLFLLPTLVVPVVVGLEHRLYLPMVGILIVLVSIKSVRAAPSTPGRIAIASLVLFGCGVLSWNRVSAFSSRQSFWEAAAADSPHSSLALFNLGTIRLKAGQLTEAGDLLLRALEINPAEPMANNNLGVLHIRRKQPDKAVRYFEREIRGNPGYAHAYFNLAMAHSELGHRHKTVELLEKTLERNPSHQRALRLLADHYVKKGDLPRAAEYLQRLKR